MKYNIDFYEKVKKYVVVLFDVFYKREVEGIENIPSSNYILAGNHISFLDVPFLVASMPNQIRFMAKKELFEKKFVNYIFSKMGAFPIDRNIVDYKALKEAFIIIKNGGNLGIFPEGTRGREITEFKSGTSILAYKTNTLVVPFGISGSYKLFKKMYLKIGEPIDFKKLNLNKDEMDNYLREKVKKLVLNI